ncbi:MAG: hypothetical protein Q7U97_11275 [Rhodocyclaceae bacterium]|nr:hypothetical protein [Rhodocyclaceae bacterium]
MKLTKDQRAQLVGELSTPWGSAHLICDGHRVTLQVQREGGNAIKFRVMTYVDGHFKGEWIKGEVPEAKFLRKQVRRLYSTARCKKIEKIVGKRRFATAEYDGYRKTLTHYLPDWASGKAAIAHLCKVCESVELAPPEALPAPTG